MATVERTERPLWGVEELCDFLNVPPSWVYRRVGRAHPDPLPGFKAGGLLRFDPDEVRAWLEAHRFEAEGPPDLP